MSRRRRRAAVLLIALDLDLLAGDPPNRWHPVAWLGRGVAALDRRAPRRGAVVQLLWGAAVAGLTPLLAALVGWMIERGGRRLGLVGLALTAAALKSSFAVRGLLRGGDTVRLALESGDIAVARAAVANLVSRETAGLDAGLVAAAAIESLAENSTDSFTGPWLAYAVAGLPGAFAYRAVNTLDSMLGYRGRYEYLGKAAARLDDLVNVLPARLGAALLVVAAPVAGGSARRAVAVAWRDHRRTASPNAGWTMAAIAGALGVRLEKRDHYVLGAGPDPTAHDIRRAGRIIMTTAALAVATTVTALLSRPARAAHVRRPAAGRAVAVQQKK